VIVDEETYLEHYGVKGMRWGQRRAGRKQTKPARKALAKKRKKEARANRSKNEKIASAVVTNIRVAPVALMVAGAIMNSSGSQSASSIPRSPRATGPVIRQRGRMNPSTTTARAQGFINSETTRQATDFLRSQGLLDE
jgi:hypothetical protein